MDGLKPEIDLARERVAALRETGSLKAQPVEPPAGLRKNRTAAAVCAALLEGFADLSPFVYDIARADEFNLLAKWGIDPAPLSNFNSPQVVKAGIYEIFGEDVADLAVDYQTALDYLGAIKRDRILGKSTAAKMAYLKPITGRALKYLSAAVLKVHFEAVLTATIDLLQRQAGRLKRQAAACTHIDRLVLDLAGLVARFRLKTLFASHPFFSENPDLFYQVYADDIAQLAADHFSSPCFTGTHILDTFRYIKKEGVEVTFARRSRGFIQSGDYYGDCTAGEVRSQVDPEIANIHWTVYAWMLDPHYRILEVLFHGRRVLKGHILPLIIQGRRVLMLDAIETIPSIRDFVRGKQNRHISTPVYARRTDLLQALFEAVKDLGARMGVEAIYVDKYSNTRWVRTQVDRLPADSYHIDDVVKPFDNALIAAVIQRILGRLPEDMVEEIQARNISLMDQQLRPNYKEVGVLTGRRKDYFIAIRGI